VLNRVCQNPFELYSNWSSSAPLQLLMRRYLVFQRRRCRCPDATGAGKGPIGWVYLVDADERSFMTRDLNHVGEQRESNSSLVKATAGGVAWSSNGPDALLPAVSRAVGGADASAARWLLAFVSTPPL